MSVDISNSELNNYFKNNNKLITLESFNNPDITTPTNTIFLENSIIKYSLDLKFILCFKCSTNLTTTNYIKHLKVKHKLLYNTYKDNNTLENLENKIKSLEFNTLDDLTILLKPDTYYIKELPILFNNYKCLECFYTSTNRKTIRNHFNRNHTINKALESNNTSREAYYIINNIPLQLLEGFKNNTKIYFIPKLPKTTIIEDTLSTRNYRDTNSSNSDDNNSNDSKDSPNYNPREIDISNKELILEKYNKDKKEKEKDLLYTTSIEGNKKLLSSFITKSNILVYLENKNRDLLVNLAYRSLKTTSLEDSPTDLEEEVPIDFLELNKAILAFFETSSSKINNINILLRQRLRSNKINLDDRDFKDFIPLESRATKNTYFTIFSNLIIFLLKVFYIRNKFRDSLNKEEKEYYLLTKEIYLSRDLLKALKKIINTDLSTLEIDENRISFNYNLSRIFIELLRVPSYLSFTKDNNLTNIVIIFFYINSLDRNTTEIKPILDIGKLTSIIIYDSRLATIGYYYYKEISEDLESSKLEEEIEGFLKRYLASSSKNYFEFISTLRPYILALSKEATSTNFLIIESKPNIIEVNSTEYSIDNIKIFFKEVFYKVENTLVEKLLGLNSIEDLALDFTGINDTPLLKRVGDSILDLEVNSNYKYKPYFITELLTPNTYYNKRLFKGIKDSKIIFKRNKIEKFNSDINRFLEYLAIAIYLFSGGPLRGTELTTILFKNIDSKSRSILFNKDDYILTITTDYYKSKNITRKEKVNIRYLPPLLSKLIVIYILYIIPFKEYILEEVYNLANPNTPYLLVKDNKPLTSNVISRIINKESSRLFNKGLTLSSYRKIINYIIKTRFNNLDYFSSSNDNLSDKIEDKQSNRSTKTSYNHYFNIGSFFTNFKNLESLSKIKEFSFTYFNYFNLLEVEDLINNPKLSSNLKKTLVENNYINIPNYTSLELTTTTKDLERNIKLLYKDPKLGFKNKKQEEGLINIVNNIPVLTFINKTSSGKSLLYLLPSFIFKSRVYIIITPRVTLTTDLYNRAKELGLDPSNISDPLNINSNLYFINIEDLNTPELDNIISNFKRYNKDITIYIDEIHLFLLEANYRLRLKYFPSLLKYKANLIFLSATLPTILLKILETTLNIKGINKVIRGNSNRDDIVYNRLYYKTNNEELLVLTNTLKEIEDRDKNLKNKILVFINNTKKGIELEDKLNLDFIYSNKANRDNILRDFLGNSSRRAILTTSILEVGLDLPDIKYTIILEPIFSLTSIIQSSGRIRASGTTYIIAREPSKYSINNIKDNTILKDSDSITTIENFKELDKAYYKLFTIESKCLRIPIGIFLDNIPTKCLEDSNYKCSLCFDRDLSLNKLKDTEESNSRYNNYKLLELEELLIDYYNNYCFKCLIDPYNLSNSYKHSYNTCFSLNNNLEIKELILNIKDTISNSNISLKNKACFKCLLPNNICLKLKEEYNIEGSLCFFKDYIYNILAILFYYRENLESILEESLLSRGLDHFIKYLTKEASIANTKVLEIINLISNLNIPNLLRDIESSFNLKDLSERSPSNTSLIDTPNLEDLEDLSDDNPPESNRNISLEEIDKTLLDNIDNILDLTIPSPNLSSIDSNNSSSSIESDLELEYNSNNPPSSTRDNRSLTTIFKELKESSSSNKASSSNTNKEPIASSSKRYNRKRPKSTSSNIDYIDSTSKIIKRI